MLPFVTHDLRFERLVIGHANLEKVFTGCRWAEGPAYFPAGRYLGPRGELIRQLL
jgi:gluconolactonase